MSFFSIFLALVLEQARPMARQHFLHEGLRQWASWVARNVDAGQKPHGWLAWLVAVGAPSLLVLWIHWLLVLSLGWVFAVVWNVALLYTTLGFRQFSHHFTDLRDALEDGNEALARELLAQWQQVDASELPRSEIVRHVIEHSIIDAHRHVFGVFVWYALLSVIGLGPVGAVAYRVSEFISRFWAGKSARISSARFDVMPSESLSQASRQAWHGIDWLPARATALGFAIMGSFEDAMDGWRNHAQKFPNDNDGVILAATAGAIHIQLGGAPLKPSRPSENDADTQDAQAGGDSTPGRVPEVAHLAQVVGLVWRTVIMWLVLVALLSLANVLG
jgi:adenosylcobinamide-phosphate synthase